MKKETVKCTYQTFTVSFIYSQEYNCSIKKTQKETADSASGILKNPAGSENAVRINAMENAAEQVDSGTSGQWNKLGNGITRTMERVKQARSEAQKRSGPLQEAYERQIERRKVFENNSGSRNL
ncbi:hypothetical protein [Diplocloster agilis]|uniref:hypothetical protein n=1 Tax=Diplocloster agilis TaxID=2850323 RepID=UPI00130DF645|nr:MULTISPECIES: hypothetical protein [Lachnospiraceae]MBU9742293.1 hypothetical protein [Diplocloster agilis]MCU6732993.1 hypothetical protein [Suonthocola fibrivorans]